MNTQYKSVQDASNVDVIIAQVPVHLLKFGGDTDPTTKRKVCRGYPNCPFSGNCQFVHASFIEVIDGGDSWFFTTNLNERHTSELPPWLFITPRIRDLILVSLQYPFDQRPQIRMCNRHITQREMTVLGLSCHEAHVDRSLMPRPTTTKSFVPAPPPPPYAALPPPYAIAPPIYATAAQLPAYPTVPGAYSPPPPPAVDNSPTVAKPPEQKSPPQGPTTKPDAGKSETKASAPLLSFDETIEQIKKVMIPTGFLHSAKVLPVVPVVGASSDRHEVVLCFCAKCNIGTLHQTTMGYLVRQLSEKAVETIEVFAKMFSPSEPSGTSNSDAFHTEVNSLVALRSAVGEPLATANVDSVNILITRNAGRDLTKVLTDPKCVSLEFKQRLCRKLLKVTQHCHAQRWGHLDLKPQNVCMNDTEDLRFIDLEQSYEFVLASMTNASRTPDAQKRIVATEFWSHPEQWLALQKGAHLFHRSLDWDLFPLVLLIGDILLLELRDPDDRRPILSKHIETSAKLLSEQEKAANEKPHDFSPLLRVPPNLPAHLRSVGSVVERVVSKYCREIRNGSKVTVESLFDDIPFFREVRETKNQAIVAHELSETFRHLRSFATTNEVAACRVLFDATGSPNSGFVFSPPRRHADCLNIVRNFVAHPRPGLHADDLWIEHTLIAQSAMMEIVLHLARNSRVDLYAVRKALPQEHFAILLEAKRKELEKHFQEMSRDLSSSHYCSNCPMHCPSGQSEEEMGAHECNGCQVHCPEKEQS